LNEKLSERGSVHQNQDVPALPHEDRQDYAAVPQGQRERAPLDQNPAEPGPLSQDGPTRAHDERDYQARASVRDRQKEPTPPEHASMPDGQPKGALLGETGRTPLEQDQQEPAPVEQAQKASAPLPQDQRAPLQGEHQEGASAHQEQRGRAPLDRPAHKSLRQNQQTRTPLEAEPREEGASVQEDRQDRARVQEEQQESPSEYAAQQAFGIQADVAAATVGTMPQEITLHLATLPFEGAEPTSDTAEQLAALAERLLREPALSVSIEAEFEAPDPAARTEMERRVEMVRAILVRRGIAPMRLVVRPAGHDRVPAPATSLPLEPRE
jgi:hypothetical protein